MFIRDAQRNQKGNNFLQSKKIVSLKNKKETMPAGAPKYNLNAEKWTLKEAEKLFNDAIVLSNTQEYDFLGEIAFKLGLYKEIFTYLSDKYPELKHVHKLLLSNCEANCFYNGKKKNIEPSLAIMNLKSNYNWTDRLDNTTKGKSIKPPIQWNDE